VSGLPKSLNHFIEERRPVTASLSAIDHEQRPNVTGLMVCAGEALDPRIVLGNKENRLIEIPLDLCGRDERPVVEPIFSGSMPNIVNARQIEFRGMA
jgi:hypothetical protein